MAWEKHQPYIELLSQVNNSFVFVSLLHVKYLFISQNFKTLLGLSVDADMNLENDLLEEYIHPDDLPILLNLQKRTLDYVFNLPHSEQANYKHVFDFRVLGISGQYIRVICQYQLLETEDPVLLLGVVDISPDQDLKAPVKFRLVNFKTGNIVNIPIIDNPDVSLTKREVEVLKMVDEGLMSKEISDKLYISIHTVNRHRQNILEKMNVNNLSEAINYAKKLGLLA
ncbi:helix-turn-helix transcriptional regulator [Bacteroides faecium]|uniref:Helix-turn-helix transcriptional regulator n=1 Tax=Bacteroides faecium TaxID=2715212 RepID=A0A6H0KWA3_9BACE|nr:helix-turn-helix transcriptional regulator [Bacteroides faecium]